MKEFSKLGDYYVKDAQAREDVEGIKADVETVKESLANIPTSVNPLPEVSVVDNGKVLTVVDGVWKKADAPSAPSSPSTPNITVEQWEFVREDGAVVTKKVCLEA